MLWSKLWRHPVFYTLIDNLPILANAMDKRQARRTNLEASNDLLNSIYMLPKYGTAFCEGKNRKKLFGQVFIYGF